MLISSHSGAAASNGHEFSNEREILYKLFFDMKKDVTELKKMFVEILRDPSIASSLKHNAIAGDFKEIKISGAESPPGSPGPCTGIELCWNEGKLIRFPQVDQLVEFLKKVA